MKSTLKFFLIMLLPAVAAWATSCQDDDRWKPTWALPLVKEQTITIGDFIEPDAVKEVNDKVKEKWDEYVEEKFAVIDSANVDSIAYAVLAEDTTSTYVTFKNGIPELNDSTKTLIRENLKENGQSDAEATIEQINSFLEAYGKAGKATQTQSSKAKARPRDSDGNSDGGSSDYYGGGSAIHNLLDAMIHPTDVFITAANLLSTMGKDYLGSINDQIDSLLEQTNMADTINLKLSEYVGEGTPIDTLNIYLDINNSLPFDVKLSAGFIGVDSEIIDTTFSDSKELQHSKLFSGEELEKIVAKSTGVAFSVKVKREKEITGDILRTLSQKPISFSLRVNVQAPIKLKF